MTGYIILGGILSVLLLLLFSKVMLRLELRGENISIKLGYIFFTFDLSPDVVIKKLSEGKKKEKPAEKKELSEEEAASEKKKNPAPLELLELVSGLIQVSDGARRILRNHIVLDRLRVKGDICGSDAHKAALNYANISSAIYIAVSLLDSVCAVKAPDILIAPDFIGEKSRFEISFCLFTRPWFVIAAALNFAVRFLYLHISKKPRKGGIKHESAASCQ